MIIIIIYNFVLVVYLVIITLNMDLIMNNGTWQHYLDSGNNNFYDGHWNNAKLYYLQAYDVLFDKCQTCPNCIESLMGYVATCHNLAALFEKLGDMPLALKFVTIPNEYCQALLQNQNNQELQLLAIKALNLTYRAKVNFLHQHPNVQVQTQEKPFSLHQQNFQQAKQIH